MKYIFICLAILSIVGCNKTPSQKEQEQQRSIKFNMNKDDRNIDMTITIKGATNDEWKQFLNGISIDTDKTRDNYGHIPNSLYVDKETFQYLMMIRELNKIQIPDYPKSPKSNPKFAPLLNHRGEDSFL